MTVLSQEGQDRAPEPTRPTSEVPEKANRRKFDAVYGSRTLEETATCVASGTLGELPHEARPQATQRSGGSTLIPRLLNPDTQPRTQSQCEVRSKGSSDEYKIPFSAYTQRPRGFRQEITNE